MTTIRLLGGRYDGKRLDNGSGILRAGDLVIIRAPAGYETFYNVMLHGQSAVINFTPFDTTDGLTYGEGELI